MAFVHTVHDGSSYWEQITRTAGKVVNDIECASRVTSLGKRTFKAVKQFHESGMIILSHENVVRFTELTNKLSHACDVFLMVRFVQDTYKFVITSCNLLDTPLQKITYLKTFVQFLRFLKAFSLGTKVAFIFQKMRFFQMSKPTQNICMGSYPIIKIIISLSDIIAALEMLHKINAGKTEELDAESFVDAETGHAMLKSQRRAGRCSSPEPLAETEDQKIQKSIATILLIKVITSFIVGVLTLGAMIAGLPQIAWNLAIFGICIDLVAYSNHLAALAYRACRFHNSEVLLPGEKEPME